MEILPEDPPWMLGPASRLMPMGNMPIYTSTLNTSTPTSSTPKVSSIKLLRDVGGLEASPYLMETIKMAFMALNLTHPEATEACWLCLQPLPPYFEAFGVNGSYEILDKADICRWETPKWGRCWHGLSLSVTPLREVFLIQW